MIYNNQIVVFVISFLIVGFFLLSSAEKGFSGSVPGGPPCCLAPSVCTGGENAKNVCDACEVCTFIENAICVGQQGGDGTCVSIIPTFNEWGKIITISVIGLFAVIGIFAMRRRNAVTS